MQWEGLSTGAVKVQRGCRRRGTKEEKEKRWRDGVEGNAEDCRMEEQGLVPIMLFQGSSRHVAFSDRRLGHKNRRRTGRCDENGANEGIDWGLSRNGASRLTCFLAAFFFSLGRAFWRGKEKGGGRRKVVKMGEEE